jgi:Fe-S cluster assembly ATP-binding protein
MIQIEKLAVQVANTGEKIIDDISLNFDLGKNYCLLWKNGSGKSTLSAVLAWSPKYEVTDGWIRIEWKDLLEMSPEERSQMGIFLSFQNVPEIPWVKMSEYLRTIYNQYLKYNSPDTPELSPFIFKRHIKKYLSDLEIDESFLERDLNVWFSGWEKRKLEILQMKLLSPKYIILDEIDSGLDLDAFRKVCELLKSIDTKENTLIIITHYFKILEYIDVDSVHIMKAGTLAKSWGKELVEQVMEWGYDNLV